ncbi:lipocalin-like domain-containing protein [Williamwhitmania taraxaci]|uniref:Lipocalin-like domain-containing protein n=1 Tax=Williamwhitmania taraxaci TaxID=1640674 RepID=A0A1G6T962_9BACT|nr:lipocalin family protein [Williamwhitmania taraxaci]SDD24885.1 Lipocalin-like domain-containing protein [Williamwhitmania taraxaci]
MKKYFGLLMLAVVVLSGFLFSSCKKEKTEVNMIVKNWTLDSKTIAGVDVTRDCEENAKWNFRSDDTYVITNSCNDKTGTWSVAEDGKTLTLDGVTAYKVIESSVSKLVIELQVGDVGLTRWTFN